MNRKRRPLKSIAVALLLSSAIVAAPQVTAFEAVVVGTRHFFECMGLMLSKPDVHEQECLPNRVGPVDLYEAGSGELIDLPPAVVPAPPVIVPQPPIVQPEPPVVEPEPPVEEPEPPIEPEEPVDPPQSGALL